MIKVFGVKHMDYLACDTLRYSTWKAYYGLLTEATGVVIGASDDETGNIKYGGDWVMETTGQDIELLYFTKSIEYYKYVLNVGNHTIVISNGSLYGTGDNNDGQLGLAGGGTVNTLTQIPLTAKTPKAIACGGSHTIVLMTDGSLYGTGSNNVGQLGLTGTVNTLTQIPLNGKTPKAIACGAFHTIVLMTDGSLYGTGYNNVGQLGLAGIVNTLTQINPNITSIMDAFIEDPDVPLLPLLPLLPITVISRVLDGTVNLEVTWEAPPNARSVVTLYMGLIDNTAIKGNSYTIEHLPLNMRYTISVVSNGSFVLVKGVTS
jgi:hypothetical protein